MAFGYETQWQTRLSVLIDLQNRGVKDILIACIDNLNGFPQAINTVLPQTETQTCVVHQIRSIAAEIYSLQRPESIYEEFEAGLPGRNAGTGLAALGSAGRKTGQEV